MGQTLKEHGVLKLVHPGGLVEIHTISITADEVMKKNPKHCVARPDVFKYPWIVVRPESVLKPGSIFYIVPHHTIRKLMLKAQGKEKEQGTVIRTQSSNDNISVEITDKGIQGKSISNLGSSRGTQNGNCDDQSAIEYSSVDLSYFNSTKEMTPSQAADKKENTFRTVNTRICGSKAPVLSRSDSRRSCKEPPVRKERNQRAATLNNRIIPRNDAEFQLRGYPDELLSTEIAYLKDPHQLAESVPGQINILEKPVNNEVEVQQQSNKLNTANVSEQPCVKSCLKPQNDTNKTSDLRVRFMLPGDEERIMRTRLWLSESVW